MKSRIIALVATAQARKAPVQHLVDRIAAVFVPVVLLVALVTFVGWWIVGHAAGTALLAAVAVLVVAFMALTIVVSLGWLSTPDHDVLAVMSGLWHEQLHLFFQGIALLGGLELTTLLMIGLVVFLIRRGGN